MDKIELSDDIQAGLRAIRAIRDAGKEQSFFDAGLGTTDLFRIKEDRLLTGAQDLILTIEPTERMAEVIAAAKSGIYTFNSLEVQGETSGNPYRIDFGEPKILFQIGRCCENGRFNDGHECMKQSEVRAKAKEAESK